MSRTAIAAAILATNCIVASAFSHRVTFHTVDAETAIALTAHKRSVAPINDILEDDSGFWFGNFAIGASSSLSLVIDTGSADTILTTGVYEPGPTSENLGKTFSASYGTANADGSGDETASGDEYTDIMTLVGTNLTISNQTIGSVTKYQTSNTLPHQGVVGYAGYDDSFLPAIPFMVNLCENNILPESTNCRFGLAFRTNNTGNMYYGTVATDEFAGSLVNVPIDDLWTLTSSITVNGKAVISNTKTIMDSGTTIIIGPQADVQKVFAAAGIQAVTKGDVTNGYFPCDKPPNFGLQFPTSKSTTVFPILSNATSVLSRNGNNCTSVIRGTKEFGALWLVGQVFFQGKYVDHNLNGNGNMGFANLINP